MKILSIGTMDGLSNTCLHRHWALEEVAGGKVDTVNTSCATSLWYRIANRLFLYGLPTRLPDNKKVNKEIINKIGSENYDIVWIDKGITINPETLAYIKRKSPDTVIASYSPDNMALRHNQSRQYLQCVPLYDYIITNKSYIIDDMWKLGAKNVIFVNNSYSERFHRPMVLSADDKKEFGCDVGFVGVWEKERCESVLYLAKHGIKVKVFGNYKWDKYADYSPNLQIAGHLLYGEDYCKSLCAARISLGFLRKMNFDRQTTRSVEIPACGGFMLAERTDEHLAMFAEGKEAAYFSSDEELLEKCLYYLNHEEERKKIAQAGRERCLKSGYGNRNMVKYVLKNVLSGK